MNKTQKMLLPLGVQCTCNPSPLGVRMPWDWQFSQSMNSRVNSWRCLKTQGKSHWGRHPISTFVLHTCAHVHTWQHIHILHTHTKILQSLYSYFALWDRTSSYSWGWLWTMNDPSATSQVLELAPVPLYPESHFIYNCQNFEATKLSFHRQVANRHHSGSAGRKHGQWCRANTERRARYLLLSDRSHAL